MKKFISYFGRFNFPAMKKSAPRKHCTLSHSLSQSDLLLKQYFNSGYIDKPGKLDLQYCGVHTILTKTIFNGKNASRYTGGIERVIFLLVQ